jgi:hypothetical protein
MPPRRTHELDNELAPDARIHSRWETERDVVRFAALLLAWVDGAWRAVMLFDCSHDDRNDRHRYDRDGTKHPAEPFHTGSPAEAMRAASSLIRTDYRRMIEQWQR